MNSPTLPTLPSFNVLVITRSECVVVESEDNYFKTLLLAGKCLIVESEDNYFKTLLLAGKCLVVVNETVFWCIY
jgi:hypothetical protein